MKNNKKLSLELLKISNDLNEPTFSKEWVERYILGIDIEKRLRILTNIIKNNKKC